MNGGQLPTNQLHDINRSTRTMCVHVRVCMCAPVYACVCAHVCVSVVRLNDSCTRLAHVFLQVRTHVCMCVS